MNAHRTLYARNAFAAASLALIGSLAAVPAQAQPTGRAQVRALTEAAVARGEIDAQRGESDGLHQPLAPSPLSRAEVRGATEQALRDGRIDAQLGESYGSRPLALRAGRNVL